MPNVPSVFSSLIRAVKGRLYPLLPGWRWFAKKRKGLTYRFFPQAKLLCQLEQDRVFWDNFLPADGTGYFVELGGNGVVGSHTLGLELLRGWKGAIQTGPVPTRPLARVVRKCRILGPEDKLQPSGRIDLLAIHSPSGYPECWKDLRKQTIRPGWVIVENREADPGWGRQLADAGYQLKLFLHDDEYYRLRSHA